MQKKLLIAENFALAILSFCDTQAKIEAVSEQNFTIFKLFKQNPELIRFFKDPFVLKEAKQKALDDIFAASDFLEEYKNGFRLFLDHNHAPRIFDLIQTINFRVLELLEKKVVDVYAPYRIEPDQRARLEKALKQKYQSDLVFDYHIDESIVLGIRVRINDYIEDYSLKSNLDNLKQLISAAQQG